MKLTHSINYQNIRILSAILCFSFILLFGCNSDKTPSPQASPTWNGKLFYNFDGAIHEYSFNSKTQNQLFDFSKDPSILKNGSLGYIGFERNFPKIKFRNFSNGQITIAYQDTGNYAISSPQFSPDGSKIAFNYFRYSNASSYPIQFGTVVTDITENYISYIPKMYNAVWLPDGRLVIVGDRTEGAYGVFYGTPSANAGLHIVTLNGNNYTFNTILKTNASPSPLLPSVSPDGKKVAFKMEDHIWLIDIDGKNLKQLTKSSITENTRESYSTWSPDGKFLAIWSNKTFETGEDLAIAIVPTDSVNVVLTNASQFWPRNQNNERLYGRIGNIAWN